MKALFWSFIIICVFAVIVVVVWLFNGEIATDIRRMAGGKEHTLQHAERQNVTEPSRPREQSVGSPPNIGPIEATVAAMRFLDEEKKREYLVLINKIRKRSETIYTKD